jgi:transmembrane sensor
MKPSRTSAIEAARAKRISYDDLRERRLIQATWSRFRNGASEAPHAPWITLRRVTLAGGALAVAVSIGAIVHWELADAPRAPASIASAPLESQVRFADGSQATLLGSAGIRTVIDGPERVEVVQRAGKVHYKVRPNHKREFVVRAGDVSVTVLGTQFSVDLGESLAEVRVFEGRVRIDDSRRTTELAAGETLNVQAWHAQTIQTASASATLVSDESPSLRDEMRGADKPAALSAQELLAQADEARAAQNWDEAVRLLRTLLARHPGAANKSNVLFMLARAERNRGSHAEAAAVFAKCAALGGTLGSEALAEEAASWLKAGQRERAVEAARRYVKRYPDGPQAQKMRNLTE